MFRRFAPAALAFIFLAACDSGNTPTGPNLDLGPQYAISDGAQDGGNPNFFFLPPMVKNPVTTGTFDASRSPVVTICEWDVTGGPAGTGVCKESPATGPWVFTMSTGIVLDAAGELYQVNWKTDDVRLATIYRLRVFSNSAELGFADLTFPESKGQAKNLSHQETISLNDGRTLPIKFRIQENAELTAVGCDPTLSEILDCDVAVVGAGEPGEVVVSTPEGALAARVDTPEMSEPYFLSIDLLPNSANPTPPEGAGEAVPYFVAIKAVYASGGEVDFLADGGEGASLVLCQYDGGEVHEHYDEYDLWLYRVDDTGEAHFHPKEDTHPGTLGCESGSTPLAMLDSHGHSTGHSRWEVLMDRGKRTLASLLLPQPLHALHGGLNGVGVGLFSTWGATTLEATLPDAPLAPSELGTTVVSPTQIDLAWTDNATTETGYRVERCSGAGCSDFTTLITFDPDATAHSDGTAAEGTTYRYVVYAVNSGGDSNPSNEAEGTTPLVAPTSLAVTATTTSSLTLSWTDNSGAEESYEVERCAGSGCTDFTTLTTLTAGSTGYTDTDLSSAATYAYRVRATATGGVTSEYSNAAEGTTDAGDAPALPTPQLIATGAEYQKNASGGWSGRVLYDLSVTNWSEYSNTLFQSTSAYGPCGSNETPARTWVDIHRATDDARLYGFCALGSASTLQTLFVSIMGDPQDGLSSLPPDVYVTFTDRALGRTVRSNTVSLAQAYYDVFLEFENEAVGAAPSSPPSTASYTFLEPGEIFVREETPGAPTNQFVALESDGADAPDGSPSMSIDISSPPTSGLQRLEWRALMKSGFVGGFLVVRDSNSHILALMDFRSDGGVYIKLADETWYQLGSYTPDVWQDYIISVDLERPYVAYAIAPTASTPLAYRSVYAYYGGGVASPNIGQISVEFPSTDAQTLWWDDIRLTGKTIW